LISSISDSSFLLKNAYAHAIPINETPAPDSIFEKDDLPSKVIIDFSERPVPSVSTIQVLNEKNERVDNGDFVIIGDHDREAMTTLDTKKLTDGVYTVSWMAQSADDGHIAKGSYVFVIGNVEVSSSAKTSSSIEGLANDQQNYKVQAVTSSLDGLIKWPLIISQITVIGVIFSHLFLWDLFGKKIIITKNKKSSANPGSDTVTNNMMSTSRYNKRFTFILVIACVTIIISTNVLLFLQVIELVPNNNMSTHVYTFLSLMQGPSGFLWFIRMVTSIIIIVCLVAYYYFIKNQEKTESNKIKSHTDLYRFGKEDRINSFKKINLNNEKLVPLLLLSISFIAGSISIFANSLTSHNAAVEFFPTIAVFLDWIHFMGVSLWIGGLFYISAVLLTTIKERTKNRDQETINESIEVGKKTVIPNKTFSVNIKKRFIFNYYLALLLPRFSLIATLSLGIIGISGIYMAWVNIHSFNFLFNSEYGHILIIKLTSIVPLIILGGYHQLKLHKTVVRIASLGENGDNSRKNSNIDESNIIDFANNRKKNLNSKQKQNTEKTESNQINIFGKFSKTIKIESLIAIGVLLVASLLTTTSPPSSSTSMNMPSMDEDPHTMMMMSHDGFGKSNNMPMANLKNNSYVKEVNILNVTTKLEINPFHSGLNTFKITFTDSHKEPYSNISTVRMIFKNEQADIGPITKKLNQISPGIYAITGGYISQPGEWNIEMAAQRPSNYDLNYKFTSIINSSLIDMSTTTSTKTNDNNNISRNEQGKIIKNMDTNNSLNIDKLSTQTIDVSNPFTLSAITLVVVIGLVSFYFYKKSKQKLRTTIDLLDHNV
jgi:putative copper export protein/methionine-rich copper-binding protein CopC